MRWLLLAATPSLASCVAWPSRELSSQASAVSAACTSAAVRASACLVPRTRRIRLLQISTPPASALAPTVPLAAAAGGASVTDDFSASELLRHVQIRVVD